MTERTVSDHAAWVLHQLREQRGWSARRLAEECAALGAPQLTASVIANIETGRRDAAGRRRRDLTVDELLVLAYALATPPGLLLAPVRGDDTAALTPDTVLPSEPVLRWVAGEGPPPLLDGRQKDKDIWERNARPLLLWRELWRLLRTLNDIRAQLLDLGTAIAGETWSEEGAALLQDPEWAERFAEVQRARREPFEARQLLTLHAISRQIARMRDEGLQPPCLDDAVLIDMDRFGVPRPEAVEPSGE